MSCVCRTNTSFRSISLDSRTVRRELSDEELRHERRAQRDDCVTAKLT